MAGLQAKFCIVQRCAVVSLPKGLEKLLVKYLGMLLDRFTDYTVAHKARLLPPGASGDDYHIAPKKTHVCGPLSQYLLIPKNRYKLTLLPGQQTSKERGVGWLVEDNSPESYDSLWGEEENLNEFREVCGGVRRRGKQGPRRVSGKYDFRGCNHTGGRLCRGRPDVGYRGKIP